MENAIKLSPLCSEANLSDRVQELPLSALHPFREYPYLLREDSQMQETADSIARYGVLVPAIARPDPEGGYELISGHRRHRACALAGLETMPVLVAVFFKHLCIACRNFCKEGIHILSTISAAAACLEHF